MNWDELKEKCLKEFDNCDINGQILYVGSLGYTKGGYIFYGDIFGGDQPVAFNRSYDQMWQIMKALK